MQIRHRIIFFLGVILFFLGTMGKVIVPVPIMEELLNGQHLSIAQAASLSSAFWYAYAASQLFGGLFSDRYGGMRMLVVGGIFLVLGLLGFPFCPCYSLQIVCRILAGLGTGVSLLGTTRLLADLFPQKFTWMMGIALFIGYLGVPCGTMPMTALVQAVGWRTALIIPGVVSLVAWIPILCLSKGLYQPTRTGNALGPLGKMCRNGRMWLLSVTTATIIITYYVTMMFSGQKTLMDVFHMEALKASRVMLVVSVTQIVMTLGVNGLLKLFRGNRKYTLLFGAGCSVVGTLLGLLALRGEGNMPLMILSLFIAAVTAGYFPLFSTMAKELNPPEDTGLAVATLNFCNTFSIALFQNLGGVILKCYPATGDGFTPEGYQMLYLMLLTAIVIATIGICFLRDTRKE